MRSLITGIAGFAGRHLAALLLGRGDEVHGTLHRAGTRDGLRDLTDRHAGFADRLRVADVTDADAIAAVIAEVSPEAIFHLAGVTFIPESVADPAATMRINLLGTVNV